MTANQKLQVVTDDEWIGMTDHQRLLQLFAAVWRSTGDLVVWQRDEPEAMAAINAWCRAKRLTFAVRKVAEMASHDAVVEVVGPRRARISVYLLKAGA